MIAFAAVILALAQPPRNAAERAYLDCLIENSSADNFAKCAALEPDKPSHVMPRGPVRADFDAAARKYITSRLHDPQSARIREVRGPRLGQIPTREVIGGRRPTFGWTACYAVNEKDFYGRDTGEQLWVVTLENDVWASFTEKESLPTVYDSLLVLTMQIEIASRVRAECSLPVTERGAGR